MKSSFGQSRRQKQLRNMVESFTPPNQTKKNRNSAESFVTRTTCSFPFQMILCSKIPTAFSLVTVQHDATSTSSHPTKSTLMSSKHSSCKLPVDSVIDPWGTPALFFTILQHVIRSISATPACPCTFRCSFFHADNPVRPV